MRCWSDVLTKDSVFENMELQHLKFNLVLLFLSLHFQSFVYGKLTSGKALRKQYIRKVNDHIETTAALTSTRSNNTKGIRKDLVDSLVSLGGVQAPLFPVNIEHIRDYPVPVPVKHEIAENVLHVHIHDSKFAVFNLLFSFLLSIS